jgi:hypothetical protein
MVAFATIVIGSSSIGCGPRSTQADDGTGDVAFALTLPGGQVIDTVDYTITGNGIPPMTGTIDVSALETNEPTVLISGLPQGGYTVTMTAASRDGQSCAGATPFVVASGQTAQVIVILQCSLAAATGEVAINARLDQCPFITGISASALQAPVGGDLTVGVAATDLDGDPISYAWTIGPPMTGSLTPPNAATAVFHCDAVGTTELSIAISDGTCGDSLTNAIPITCTAGP